MLLLRLAQGHLTAALHFGWHEVHKVEIACSQLECAAGMGGVGSKADVGMLARLYDVVVTPFLKQSCIHMQDVGRSGVALRIMQ
jgi:hypothetical protein